jgi:TPR repeat protein
MTFSDDVADLSVEPDLAGFRDAQNLLPNNPSAAVQMLEDLAGAGSRRSMVELGWQYASGKTVKKDLAKAKYWYERSLESGAIDATYYLGRLFIMLDDPERAVETFRLGAKLGYAPSMNLLGTMYCVGKGVARDVPQSIELFTQAAALGSLPARRNLAAILVRGRGGARRILEGWRLYFSLWRDVPATVARDPLGDAIKQ